ncbi:MAG TPA: SpvB/TcaC N-terminal domain-containing protein, partial [Polyangia bacterium]|nr:SpvB/TcaC N-terminal domain-containing protein [Polyangia bacterium]
MRHPRAPFLLLLLATCGGQPSKDSTTATGSLRAAPDIGTALNGRIQSIAAAGNLIAASTSGAPDVGDDGAASYSIPIWVPDGVRGLQPSLSIDYRSDGGVGTLGPKWSIGGLSVIKRCAKNRSLDGAQTRIDFKGDTFCLDGQRLLRLNGTANSTGEFRTRRNSFVKIMATAADGGGIQTFKVYQPDGRIFWYGRSAQSRLAWTGFTFGRITTPARTFGYYLDKIEDRYGNEINISYNSSTASSGPLPEPVPSSITWGGNGPFTWTRDLQFNYDATQTQKSTRWIADGTAVW